MMTYLCGGLAARGHRVTLLTLDNSVPDFYPLSSAVERVRLDLPALSSAGFGGGLKRLFTLLRAVRRTRPHVLISFMTVSVLAASWLLRIPYIYADHLDARFLAYSRKWQFLRNFLLRFAYAVTVLSQRDLQFLQQHHPRWRTHVIYNPALVAPSKRMKRPDYLRPNVRFVLAVGRLTAQKGFDRLLQAWSRLGPARAGWRLAIIGGGEDEEALHEQARSLQLEKDVDFVSPQKDIFPAYKQVELFVMSSRAEGFPLVLLEAMSCGVPAVSFNCTGPDVIIRHGIDGLLVPQDDISALAAALAELMQNEQKRLALAQRAPEVTERFSLDNYLSAYETLCNQARLSV